MDNRRTAMRDILDATEAVERASVLAALDKAFRTIQRTTFGFELVATATRVAVRTIAMLALLAPLVVVLWMGRTDFEGWTLVGVGLLAIALYIVWDIFSSWLIVWQRRLRITWSNRRRQAVQLDVRLFDFRTATLLLLIYSIPMTLLAFARTSTIAPPWLVHGWFHKALLAASLVLLAWGIVTLAANLLLRLHWLWVLRRMHKTASEERLVNNTANLIVHFSYIPSDRVSTADTRRQDLEYIDVIEQIAKEFEEHWPRHIHSKQLRVKATARAWARQVSAAMRSEQLPMILGQRRAPDLRMPLGQFIVKFILRQSFDVAPQSEDHHQHIAFWRRIGRPLLAVVLIAAGVALVLMAVWQPGLPQMLESWGFPDPFTVITEVPKELRPAVLGAAVASFTIFVKVVAPEKAQNRFGDR